jgi:hypothetical protein
MKVKSYLLSGLLLAVLGSASAQVATFNFTGGIQTFTVPCGVDTLFLQTWGAQGGSGASGNSGAGPTAGGAGGLGGYAEGWLLVSPGDVLNIFVGGQGATPTGGFNGGANGGSQNAGGGGGATDIRVGGTAEANRVITAGGGGGGGRGGCESQAAIAGGAGSGGGSGLAGTNGQDAPTSGGSAGGGRGGNFGNVQGASGAAGVGCSGFLGSPGGTATTGTGASGGAGQSCCCFSFGSIPAGGGGGGGQVGGGGGGGGSAGTSGCSGNDKGAGGGGGGGSSYVGGVIGGVTNAGIWLGDGMATISWTVPVPPAHTITGAGAMCEGDTVSYSIPADQYSTFYTWTVPSGLTFVSGQNTTGISVAGVTPGNYMIYVYGVNGTCSLTGPTDSISVTVNALPAVAATASAAVCIGGNVTLTASGASTYVWQPGALTGTTETVSPSTTTTYTLSGTDVNGCVNMDTTTAVINQLPVLTASANAAICAGDSASISVTGAASYVWMPGNLTGSAVIVMPSATTTYTVTGTDANGCSNTTSTTVTVNALPTVTLTAQGTHCFDDAAYSLTGGAPAGGAYSGPGVSAGTFTPATAGNGTHTITYSYADANGCSSSATSTVVVDACASIAEASGFYGVTYTPNPATDVMTVRWDAAKTEVNSVEVRDVTGRVVLTENVSSNGNVELNVASLPAGNYTLVMINNSAKANYSFIKK